MLRTILFADTIWLLISLVFYGALYVGVRWWRKRKLARGGDGIACPCVHCPRCNRAPHRSVIVALEERVPAPCIEGNILCAECSCKISSAPTAHTGVA